MRNRIIIAAACALLLAVAATVFGVMQQERHMLSRECELYFLNESETTLVSEARTVKYRDVHGLRQSVLEELVKGPETNRNKSVLNRKTKLLSVEETAPGELVADFNLRFMSGDSAKDTLAAYAVIKTLCGLDGVERVKVTVEKNDIPDSEGEPIGFLADEDINLSTDTNTSETREIVLYFADAAANKLVPEMRTIKVTDQLPLAQYIITELIHGPENESLTPVLDPETMLLSVTITDNICFVNMQSNFISRNTGSEDSEILAVYSIVNSLTELDNIGRVQFLIDGKKADTFGSLRLDELFERNTSVILQQ